MNALARKFQPSENLEPSFDFENRDVADYQNVPDINYNKLMDSLYDESAIEKAYRSLLLLGTQTRFTTGSIPLSTNRVNLITGFQPEVSHYWFIYAAKNLNYAQPSDLFKYLTIDSRFNYVFTSQENELVDISALEEEFHSLVKQWEGETSFHSSLGEIFTNEAYQRIMAMGRDALPLILSDLQRKPRHWFYALEKIVGFDVAIGAKKFGEARAAWLQWGYKNKYIKPL